MRIAGIGVKLPSRVVSNEDVLREIARVRQADSFSNTIGRSLARLLEATGAALRYHRAEGELVRDLTRDAMASALARAGLRHEQVDLLIHCSLGRGFLEPGNAYFTANLLGLRCDCFDVADACMGWLRAASIAQDALAAGRYRNVLVVCTEFGAREYLEKYARVESPLALSRIFTAFTLGEVACATVFQASDAPWSFRFRARPDLSDLCTVTLPGYAEFACDSPRLERTRDLWFDVHSSELFDCSITELCGLLSETVTDIDTPDLYVPHAASNAASLAAAERSGVRRDKLFLDVMPRFGNVVSASLPLGLYCAAQAGALRDGSDVVLCPASAGVCVAVARFRWRTGGSHVAS